MTVAKIIEISAQSPNSWEEAAQEALKEVSKTIRNIRSIYIKDMEAVVEKDRIVAYRLITKITFVVDRQA
jgi:flavin-binding protein dodecin